MNQFKDDNKENLNSFEMSDESSVVEFSDSEISEEEFELDTTGMVYIFLAQSSISISNF